MWQISKMFELSQTNVNTTEIADDKDNDYQVSLINDKVFNPRKSIFSKPWIRKSPI